MHDCKSSSKLQETKKYSMLRNPGRNSQCWQRSPPVAEETDKGRKKSGNDFVFVLKISIFPEWAINSPVPMS